MYVDEEAGDVNMRRRMDRTMIPLGGVNGFCQNSKTDAKVAQPSLASDEERGLVVYYPGWRRKIFNHFRMTRLVPKAVRVLHWLKGGGASRIPFMRKLIGRRACRKCETECRSGSLAA